MHCTKLSQHGAILLPIVALATSVACGRSATQSAPTAIRLVDVFKPEMVAGSPATARREIPRTEWRFDGPPTTWEAGVGVTGLAARDGRLVGRASTSFPVLHLQRTSGLDNPDLLHAVEVRMRVSAGTEVSFNAAGAEKIDLDQTVRQAAAFPWGTKAALMPGDGVQTYTLTPLQHTAGTGLRHLMLRPTDAAGATFEIESVRLIYRKEYLASIPSGVTWQGLKEVYRESIAARSPESLALTLTLPDHPWLDLGIGTIEDGPVTFSIRAALSRDSGREQPRPLLERTVTTSHRWEPLAIDLAPFAGQSTTLTLSLAAGDPGTLGFWGSPVVRNHRAAGTAPQAASRPQGVILVQADTLRRDHLGVYGYARETAPTIRTLAGDGTLFRNYTTQATWTKVSTPTLMTSLYPSTHGVAEFYDHLPASATTLAESFRAAGYATVSFSSVLFTGQFTNLHKGFEELHEDGSVAKPESSKTSREFVDRLAAWLDAHRDTPFFAFLHVFDPHDPYEPNAPYNTMWADPAKKEEHERQLKEVRKVIKDPLMRLFGMASREELVQAKVDPDEYVAYDKDWYDGSIRGMDVEIARLFERLRGLGLDDRTLFVFLSDHGEEFHEHGKMFHGQTVYGELTQTPLIVRWPAGLPRGRVVDEVVQTIDVMPTLLDLSGIPPPAGIQGQSLVPLLRPDASNGWRRRPAISEKARTAAGAGSPPPNDTESYAIVDGGWKLIHNTLRPHGGPEYELYDFAKDPLNTTDVAAQHADVVARLGKALDGWHQMATAAKLKPDAETTKTLSPLQLQRLRSLGYVR